MLGYAATCRAYVAACCTMLQPYLPATTAGVRERSPHARIGRPGQVHLRLQLPRRARREAVDRGRRGPAELPTEQVSQPPTLYFCVT